MTRSKPWSDIENTAVVALYFDMLESAMAGEKYVKAAMIRKAQYPEAEFRGPLWNRSRQSIEFKLMNCSAAHADLYPGDETMDGHGYRAMPNYQADLKKAVQIKLNELADEAADRPAAAG